MRISDSGEFGFIDRIRKKLNPPSTDVVKGVGDDCAVIGSMKEQLRLLTTDMLVENVHFRLDWTNPYLLGRKSLAANLSDIAAMGGVPSGALIGIGIPAETELDFLDGFYEGLNSVAAEFEVSLVGGDTVNSPTGIVISVAVDGQVSESEILYRSGARPGDVVFLTARVGSAAAFLDLKNHGREYEKESELGKHHLDPRPHLKEGRIIAESKLASALIDVSDGFAADLGHICRESDVGAVIEQEKIPTDDELREYCRQFDLDELKFALQGGEDYVLLGTVAEDKAGYLESALNSAGCAFVAVGQIEEKKAIRLKSPDGTDIEIEDSGYDHFKMR
jgi:thiamine-monophosphate kinase